MQKKEVVLSTDIRDSKDVRRYRSWFFVLGTLLILLGMALISSAYTATLFSVMVFGFMLIGAGIVNIAQSILARQWSGMFLSTLLAILYIGAGALCVSRPADAALDITFLFTAFCFIAGLFRMISSLIIRFERWGWVFFNGAITFILGMLIYSQWPLSGLWVIGTFVGVDMLLCGWAWIMLALTATEE